jgi:hypothetical protein
MEILLDCIGKKIVNIETILDEGAVHSCIFHFDDGTKLEISPTSYNYGLQNLTFND